MHRSQHRHGSTKPSACRCSGDWATPPQLCLLAAGPTRGRQILLNDWGDIWRAAAEAGTYSLKDSSSSLVIGEISLALTLSSMGVAIVADSFCRHAHSKVTCLVQTPPNSLPQGGQFFPPLELFLLTKLWRQLFNRC